MRDCPIIFKSILCAPDDDCQNCLTYLKNLKRLVDQHLTPEWQSASKIPLEWEDLDYLYQLGHLECDFRDVIVEERAKGTRHYYRIPS